MERTTETILDEIRSADYVVSIEQTSGGQTLALAVHNKTGESLIACAGDPHDAARELAVLVGLDLDEDQPEPSA
jgi:hypothetical protein